MNTITISAWTVLTDVGETSTAKISHIVRFQHENAAVDIFLRGCKNFESSSDKGSYNLVCVGKLFVADRCDPVFKGCGCLPKKVLWKNREPMEGEMNYAELDPLKPVVHDAVFIPNKTKYLKKYREALLVSLKDDPELETLRYLESGPAEKVTLENLEAFMERMDRFWDSMLQPVYKVEFGVSLGVMRAMERLYSTMKMTIFRNAFVAENEFCEALFDDDGSYHGWRDLMGEESARIVAPGEDMFCVEQPCNAFSVTFS